MKDNIKKTGTYYTSRELSNCMASKLMYYVNKSKKICEMNVLDPSCGEGELLKAVSRQVSQVPLNLIGVDINEKAIEKAHNYIKKSELIKTDFFVNDYVDCIIEGSQKEKLNDIDVIIANPPYVRIQNLEENKLEKWKKHFDLTGRVDLYHVFLAAMTENLNIGGYICVITSNRYLNTAGGKSVRKMLYEDFYIEEIIDLGDTKLFDAAVLPAIFIGKKKLKKEPQNENPIFAKVYESDENLKNDSVNISCFFDIFDSDNDGLFYSEREKKGYEISHGKLFIPEKYEDYWVMASAKELKWVSDLENKTEYLFDDFFQIKVGIKTTSDKVFIRERWETSELIPELELIKPMVTSKSINNWEIIPNKTLKILYPYNENQVDKNKLKGSKFLLDINEYPNAKKYLESYKDVLSARKYIEEANREWYEIWVPHNPSDWNKTKIIFPDISSSAQFVIDEDGYLVNGNCYWVVAKDDKDTDLLYLAAAVANSSTMAKYHRIKFQNVLYSDKKRYITQYVKKYLMPDINNEHSIEIIQLMKEKKSRSKNNEELKKFMNVVDVLVEKSFNIY